MIEQTATLAPKPAHVPEALVVDFDFYDLEGSDDDVQGAYAAVQRKEPDIFWTPRNGGHWVATRGEDIIHMLRTPGAFSSRNIPLPPPPAGTPKMIPIELDPPIHAQYRRPLMQALTPGVVQHLEEDVRRVAIGQIEKLLPRGECEFIEDFAKILPIHVFMELVNLPKQDIPALLPIAEVSVRSPDAMKRQQAQLDMGAYLHKWVAERRANPGTDLLTRLVNVEVNGERISEAEAINYSTIALFGGLDTVASMMGFFAWFLADHPVHRRRIVDSLDDDAFLKAAIEEMLRRYGISNTGRVINVDFEYKGIQFKEGEFILPPNLLVGMDDRLNPDPLTVDFDREKPVHLVFGNGAHACPGAVLARRELRVFLREWLSRIPDFRVKPGTKPVLATGQVNGILELQLVWD
jgi:cytochrome P450